MRKIIVTEFKEGDGGPETDEYENMMNTRTFATGIVVLTHQPVGKESYYGHQN